MHKQIIDVSLFRALVGVGGEPGQPVVEQIYPKRMDTGKQNIQPKVKLEAINEEGVVDVGLGYLLALMVL